MDAADVIDERSAIAFALERTDARNGDDAAVLRGGSSASCVSVDSTVEGIHLPLGSAPDALGRRAVARALSDLAAMGAAPRAVTCAIHVPEGRWPDAALALEGLVARARKQGAPVVGGDFTRVRSHDLALVVTVIGQRASGRATFVGRAGGRPGDLLVVTGSIGAVLAGPPGATVPEPPDRLRAGRALAPHVRAMVDVSDGLTRDAGHLALAAGCGAALDLEAVPLAAPGLDRLRVVSTGDDYELLAAVSPDQLDAARVSLLRADDALPLTVVGRLADGSAGDVYALRGAARVELPPGFFHT